MTAKEINAYAGLEPQIQKLARSLYRSAAQHKPSLFETGDWLRKMIDRSLRDESLRAALFQFVDVLPSLRSAGEVGRHLEEYFARVDHAFGRLAFLAQAVRAGWIFAPLVKQNVSRMARHFIVEEDRDALRRVLEALRAEPAGFTLDVVGEATVSDKEALAIQCRYLDLLQNLGSIAARWQDIPQIDRGRDGALLPKVGLSVKLSSLYPRFDPLDPESAVVVRERLRPIFRAAIRHRAALTIDMEQYAYKDLTLRIFRELLEEEEFAAQPATSVAIQAYLLDTERDLKELMAWARTRNRRIGVRLVKGAYWDSEVAWAKQKNWPVPVFLDKAETDAKFERLSRLLFENADIVEAAFGSHNIRSLAHAIVCAQASGLGPSDYEIQMLYGMGEPIRRAVIEHGQRVRVYVPTGKLLPGMAYLIRRLMENTSNTSFLRQVYAERADMERLIAPPRPSKRPGRARGRPRDREARLAAPFCNEAPTDFSRRESRQDFARALREVRQRLGGSYPLVIDGKEITTGQWIQSVNPAAPAEIVGLAAEAGQDEAERAVMAAASYFRTWSATPARERAEIMIRAADQMRRCRHELAAWEVYEAGKGWREADADVVEAIDYLEYYARQMLRLAPPRPTQQVPGELNLYLYEPRGVAVVIAPWNFPLAIVTGMTAAALVSGNCAIIKPAEQAPILGSLLMKILQDAGLPPGAAHLLQGGGELGAYLVRHPAVHVIAFTGSREVGLEILRRAYDHRPGQEHVKRVVCEMGGKNAIIVDSDADLDEAIQYIVESAFGYQGQKCSAASRLILLEEIHDLVVERLVEAVRSLRIGPPEDPRNFIGPVIDGAARARILDHVRMGHAEATCRLAREAPEEGYYVGPVIFTGVEPHHQIATEEIFGPVLAVLRARDFDEALQTALRSSYALTGGLFSRSPANIERARREFRVGNLYINRGITGAVVERQPFGGLKLSGIGSKAGGPDYLLQFVEPRTISENTLRHGFVPPQGSTRGKQPW